MSDTIGKYRVIGSLGLGAMGEVLAATAEGPMGFKKTVAIKRIHPELFVGSDPSDTLVRSLINEARLGGLLRHVNLVAAHDFDHDDEGWYLVMDYVEGITFETLIKRSRATDRVIPPAFALQMAEQVCRGLEYAHALQDESGRPLALVHRDLKPANVMLDKDGVVKIMDFGIAKAMSNLGSTTMAGVLKGSPSYMSPEQAEASKEVGPRSDIFSLGAILYETLSLRRLFTADKPAAVLHLICHRDVSEEIAELDERLPGIGPVLTACLAKDPADRWADARELSEALSQVEDQLEPVGRLADYAAEWVEREAGRSADLSVSLHGLPGRGSSSEERTALERSLATNRALSVSVIVLGVLLAAALVFLLLGPRPSAAPSVLRTTQITFDPDIETQSSLSPDGATVVYQRLLGERLQLFLQRVDGHNSMPLSQDENVHDLEPAFSPDGSRIAFVSVPIGEESPGGIFLSGPTGESRRRLSDFGYDPAWSPDGGRIVFATEGVKSPVMRLGLSELWVVPSDGGEPSRLFVGDAVQPAWSPGGQRIAFWGVHGGVRDIWTVREDGSDLVQVTDSQATDWNPVWGPDGRRLYFLSDRGGSMSVWSVAIDERSGEVRGEPAALTPGSTAAAMHLSISRDGERLSYSAVRETSNLRSLEIDPETAQVIGEPEVITDGARSFYGPDPSPDGERLVFASTGGQEDLFVVDLDGENLRRLTDDGHRDRTPRWSPDGSRIVFYSNRSGRYEIWTIRPDGSDLRRLTDERKHELHNPAWSPDGRRIAAATLTGNDDSGRLFVYDVDEDAVVQGRSELSLELKLGSTPVVSSWSRDGRWLLISVSGSQNHTLVYDMDAGEVTKTLDVWGRPTWLDNGETALTAEGETVERLDVESGRREQLFTPESGSVYDVEVGSDGRRLVYAEQSSESDLWLIELD
jgi:Tol biopolymer transport system component